MSRFKKLFLLLVISVATFSLLMLTSCETKPVGAISPEPEIDIPEPAQVVGQVTDNKTLVGISDVSVSLAGYETTTDAEGNYNFEENIPGGKYKLTASKTGYVSISKNVTVYTEDATTLNLKLAKSSPTVTVTPAEGADIAEVSNDGAVTASIPPNAVTEDVEVSVTPTLGLSTPIQTDDLLTATQAAAQTNTITPLDIVFAEPVTMTAPLTLPAEYITGVMEVVRINPATGAEEVVGTASIVDGQIQYNVSTGGDFMIRAETNLVHNIETKTVTSQVGFVGPNELPGTAKSFNFEDKATVDVEQGFSDDFIETVFGFEPSSRTLTYGLTKPSGANTSITGYLPVTEETHTYTTTLGKVVARTTVNGPNNGGQNNANIRRYVKKVCVQDDEVHNKWRFDGYYFKKSGVKLTPQEIADRNLNPNPDCPGQ